MGKKDKKKKKTDKGVEADAIAALRSALDRTLQASAEGAQATQKRTREIVEEIAAAAGRVRHTLEDMRVLDEVKRLRGEVETLAARVASLEVKAPATESAPEPAAAAPEPASDGSASDVPAELLPSAARAKKGAARKPAVKRAGVKRKAAAKPVGSPTPSPELTKPAAASARRGRPKKAPAAATKPPAEATKPPATATKPPAEATKPPATPGSA